MIDAHDTILLVVLWTAWLGALVLALRQRERASRRQADDELAAGTRLVDGAGEASAGEPQELDPTDRAMVRREALRHASGGETPAAGDADARRRVAGLVVQLQDRLEDVALREELIHEYREQGNDAAAVQQLFLLAEQHTEKGHPNDATYCMQQVLAIDPSNEYAQRQLRKPTGT